MSDIEVADAVHHGPSGEDWVIARVHDGYVYPAGWPPCRANLADCTLTRKATAAQRDQMLSLLRKLPAHDERHLADNTETRS